MQSPEGTLHVKVENVLMSSQGPVVMLVPSNGGAAAADTAEGGVDRVLPIFIDQSQALNIQLALEGQLSPRPMTHDLFSAVLNELGAIVEKIVIEDLAQNTFYASLYIQVEKGNAATTKRFDARPSDCLALAVRAGAPVYVTEKLMKQASIARKDIGPAATAVEIAESDVDEDDDDDDVSLGVPR